MQGLLMEFCHNVEQSNEVEAGRGSWGWGVGCQEKDLGNVHCAAQRQALSSLRI